jgi:hypothetical protein
VPVGRVTYQNEEIRKIVRDENGRIKEFIVHRRAQEA